MKRLGFNLRLMQLAMLMSGCYEDSDDIFGYELGWRLKKMAKEAQCPVCYSYIEMEDGAGYCIMCEDVVYETDEGLSSDLVEKINKM